MKHLYLVLFLIGCQVSVPGKIKQEVSGNATTTNVIKIEISIPESLTQAFINSCKDKCKLDPDPSQCETSCNAEQQTNYTNSILALISQFQQTLAQPTQTPVPQ